MMDGCWWMVADG